MSNERSRGEGEDQPVPAEAARPGVDEPSSATSAHAPDGTSEPHAPHAPHAPHEGASDEAPEPDAPVLVQSSKKRRIASLLLLVGAGIAVANVVPHVPSERRVELRVDDAATVIGLDVTWTARGEGEPVQGSSWRFAPGAAPTSLVGSVRLPDGRYEIDIIVERTDGRTSLRRTVTLDDAENVTVPVR